MERLLVSLDLDHTAYRLGNTQVGTSYQFAVLSLRDAKRHTKKSAKPSNLNFLTNQRPATDILSNGITWREIHFGYWTNQRTIGSLLASLSCAHLLNLVLDPGVAANYTMVHLEELRNKIFKIICQNTIKQFKSGMPDF